jgi:plasmid stability protein
MAMMSYTVFVDTTLTIRADERLRAALAQRARVQGKTLSAVAREILEAAVQERLLGQRTAHLKGRVRLRRKQTDAWRKALADRNWRR